MYRNFDNISPNWLRNISQLSFDEAALSLFQYQYQHCLIYQKYVNAIGKNTNSVSNILDIPFLPISFFKSHQVVSGVFEPALIFESSGTTTTVNSKHYVKDAQLYRASFIEAFEQFYGKPSDYVFLCLLPSYLERKNASLVYMAKALVAASAHSESGFYLDDFAALATQLQLLQQCNKKVMLLGVTFALLDFAEEFPMDLNKVIVMETGGMKGRKAEWTREEVHQYLQKQWQLPVVHSEYGMTELLSQAYSLGLGKFRAANTMKLLVRDPYDPFDVQLNGSGTANIIDLANIHSCAFIATDDIIKKHQDDTFEVLGRLDFSALRGCNLMVL
jgi:phenylacetate-coenzyme A ligase PaaK-like adenylate-forming protein